MEMYGLWIGIRFSVANTMQENARGAERALDWSNTHNIVVEQTSTDDKYRAAKRTPIDPNINCGCERALDSMRWWLITRARRGEFNKIT